MGMKNVPEDLTEEEQGHLMRWHKDQWPWHFTTRADRRQFLRAETNKAFDWCRSNGKKYHDYSAFLRNWYRRSMEQRGFEPRRPPSSPVPGRQGKKPFQVVSDMEDCGPLFANTVPKEGGE